MRLLTSDSIRVSSANFQPGFCPQVQDEETQVSGGKGEDNTKEQELWIGVVPVEMDDSKASTGNQESFADAMVNKVRISICYESVVPLIHAGMHLNCILPVKDEASFGPWSVSADHSGSQPKHRQGGKSAQTLQLFSTCCCFYFYCARVCVCVFSLIYKQCTWEGGHQNKQFKALYQEEFIVMDFG